MELYATDDDGRVYTIEVESMPGDRKITEIYPTSFDHHITVTAKVSEGWLSSNESTDPTELLKSIYDFADHRIKDWINNNG